MEYYDFVCILLGEHCTLWQWTFCFFYLGKWFSNTFDSFLLFHCDWRRVDVSAYPFSAYQLLYKFSFVNSYMNRWKWMTSFETFFKAKHFLKKNWKKIECLQTKWIEIWIYRFCMLVGLFVKDTKAISLTTNNLFFYKSIIFKILVKKIFAYSKIS